MNITVFLERKNETKKLALEEKTTLAELLNKMNINPVEVVVAKNGNIVTDDTIIQDGDVVTIFSVISGG